jgi:hypothetical protein
MRAPLLAASLFYLGIAKTVGQIVAGVAASGRDVVYDVTSNHLSGAPRSRPMGVSPGRRAARICS